VKFNANGGGGKMSSQVFTINKAAKLSANAFTRKGYVFVGWSTSKTGAVAYADKQAVKNLAKGGEKVTLYAKWAVKNYLVAFFANGGSGSMALQKHVYGKSAKLSANRFKRKGYSFAGWAKKNTGEVKYRNKAAVKNLTSAGKTIKLYAVWTANPVSNPSQNQPATSSATTSTLPGDEVDFTQLRWAYGGFDGSAAKLSGNARISDLAASNAGVSYSWASGDCQDLGASSATDASCVACLFCLSGGRWSGGKFDWICTNNKSPSFKNIQDQYKGWSSGVISRAEEYAFVILNRNGTARTNVIRVKAPGLTPTTPTTPSTPATPTTPTTPTTPPTRTSADDVDFSLLQWTYGGFKGESAKLGAEPRITGLKLNNSGMSYSWKSGGCESLGATSGSDYSRTVACLFCHYGGKWVGGKFDWVSTSRRTRDFKNIHEGYNGWSPKAFSGADAYAFVIVSKDGKSRSNVIRCGK
jgi:uncharacterized repeat protein (TIGR02543 family)